MDLKATAVRGFGLMALLKLATATLGRITALILPFLLRPEDFGLFGIASFFVGLATLFNEFGLGKELVRREARFAEALTVGFTIRILLSLVLTVALIALAGPISDFYSDSRLQLLVIVLTLSLVLTSLSFTPRILAVRRLDFKRSVIPDQTGKAVGAVVTVGLAFLGLGYWSPAIGALGGLAAGAVALFIAVPWKPTLRLDRQLNRELVTFGGFVAATNFATFLAHGVDNAILGFMMGVGPLGFYLLAYTWAVQIPASLTGVFTYIGFPIFSRLGGDLARLRRTYAESVRFYAMAVTPLAVGVAVLAHAFVSTVFGSTWLPSITPMQILALSGFLIGLAGLAFSVLYSSNHPRAVFAASAVEAGLIVLAIPPAIVVAGLVGASLVSVAGSAMLLVMAQRAVGKHIHVRSSRLLRHFIDPTIASLAAVVGVLVLQAAWETSLLTFSVSVMVFGLLYAAAMTRLSRGRFLMELRELGALALRRSSEGPPGAEESDGDERRE